MGGVTEGDSQSFNQASRGEISKDLSSLKANDGALEATSHHQGETDSHSAEAETLPEVNALATLGKAHFFNQPKKKIQLSTGWAFLL